MIKGMASRQATAGLRRYTDAIAPYTIPLLRILVGITFFLTGLPKLGNLAGFTGFVSSLGLPLPGFIAVIVAVMEVVGGLLLIVGLGTRWVSLWYVFEMIVTTLRRTEDEGLQHSSSVVGLSSRKADRRYRSLY